MHEINKENQEDVEFFRRFVERLQNSYRYGRNSIEQLRVGVQDMQRAQTRYLNDVSRYLEMKNRSTKANPRVEFGLTNARENQAECILNQNVLQSRIARIEQERPVAENMERQIDNVKNNALVANVWHERVERPQYAYPPTYEQIVIETNPVNTMYTNLDGEQVPLTIGAFKLWWKIGDRLPTVRNITRTYLSHAHPCVSSNGGTNESVDDDGESTFRAYGGNVCIGSFQEPIQINATAKRFDLVLDTFFHYLRTLDSNAPYQNINNLVAEIERRENPNVDVDGETTSSEDDDTHMANCTLDEDECAQCARILSASLASNNVI